MNDSVARNSLTSAGKVSRTPLVIAKVGIIGASQMGSGIAHVCALGGYDVIISDISEDQLKKSLANIEKHMGRQVQKGAVTEADKVAAVGRIKTSTALEAMADRDLVIEAATESEET